MIVRDFARYLITGCIALAIHLAVLVVMVERFAVNAAEGPEMVTFHRSRKLYGRARGFVNVWRTRSFFRLLKKDLATALKLPCQAWPTSVRQAGQDQRIQLANNVAASGKEDIEMKVDTKARHRTKANGNVFVYLGFQPREAKRLLAHADTTDALVSILARIGKHVHLGVQ